MMRLALILATTSFLAACTGGGGGDGPQTAGSGVIPPAGGSSGSGGSNPHSFVDPSQPKTYAAIGAGHSYRYNVIYPADGSAPNRAGNEFYDSNATTVRDNRITIAYDPRSAEFSLSYNDADASIAHNNRYQDPAHRTAFGGAVGPQYGVPDITADGVLFLETGSGENAFTFANQIGVGLSASADAGSSTAQTLFYQRPGTETRYVTYAGWVRNTYVIALNEETQNEDATFTLDRAAFVFGETTPNDRVPTTGTGTYTGSMLASMVFNDQLDVTNEPTLFQWIHGNATTRVNFASSTFNLDLTGTVMAAQDDGTGGLASVFAGATFTATGGGAINMAAYGGFQGRFTDVRFNQANGTLVIDAPYLSGSSIDGTFFGPNADEVGGSFRAVGGVPDQRIDIVGAFTGRK